MDLILSLFPGADLLGQGFEAEGFCVVRGPDLVWGGWFFWCGCWLYFVSLRLVLLWVVKVSSFI